MRTLQHGSFTSHRTSPFGEETKHPTGITDLHSQLLSREAERFSDFPILSGNLPLVDFTWGSGRLVSCTNAVKCCLPVYLDSPLYPFGKVRESASRLHYPGGGGALRFVQGNIAAGNHLGRIMEIGTFAYLH